MGMFRLDIKKNILMKREGSHVGDVLIKMSECLQGIFLTRDQTQDSYIAGRFFTI